MRGTTVPPGTLTPGGDLPMHRLEVPLPATLPFAVGMFSPLSRAASRTATRSPRSSTSPAAPARTSSTSRVLSCGRRTCACSRQGRVHHWEDVRGLTGHVLLFTEDFLRTPCSTHAC
jgi:hypothetical protein